MRVLPGRPNHAGRGTDQTDAQADRSADRRCDVGEHLPMRHLPTHSRRHQICGGGRLMTVITNLSRRDLLKSAAAVSGLVLGFHVGFRKLPFAEAAEAAEGPTFAPNAFLSIDETGLVTIAASRSEMGTGIKTDLPLVLADELEADWSRVKVVQGQGDPKYGDQNTDGSRSTWQFFGPMRLAGATARQMLETAPTQTRNLPVNECQAKNGFVLHSPSGRKLAYGDLAKLAATMPVPPSSQVRLKDRKDWRYIGKPRAIVDLKDIVQGRATYGIDVVLPG